LSNEAILRAELRRLFRWLKDKGVTAVITGERGEGQLTRHGLEEYISDCVILLDHRVLDQVSTRRLRIVKYRGTTHGTNEYPFLIDAEGISVLPVTSLGLEHDASDKRVSTGISRLDDMLGGEGYFRGSSILVTGTAGTGKTSMASQFAAAACNRGEKCIYFAFEESPAQIMRNMRSIGVSLDRWVKKGLLRFCSMRSTLYGLENHLITFHKQVREFQPQVVVVDPVDNLVHAGTLQDATAMLTRLVDFLKVRGITALMTNLTSRGQGSECSGIEISSLVDTWLVLRDIELSGERNRALSILKSRGMAHSNQIREFLLTDRGFDLREVHLGPEEVLQKQRRRKREALEARIFALRKEFETEAEEVNRLIKEGEGLRQERERMAVRRIADMKPEAVRSGERRKGKNEKIP
jgi:circadian clock protein KaiC